MGMNVGGVEGYGGGKGKMLMGFFWDGDVWDGGESREKGQNSWEKGQNPGRIWGF